MANVWHARHLFGLSKRATSVGAQLHGALAAVLAASGHDQLVTNTLMCRSLHFTSFGSQEQPSGLHRGSSRCESLHCPCWSLMTVHRTKHSLRSCILLRAGVEKHRNEVLSATLWQSTKAFWEALVQLSVPPDASSVMPFWLLLR